MPGVGQHLGAVESDAGAAGAVVTEQVYLKNRHEFSNQRFRASWHHNPARRARDAGLRRSWCGSGPPTAPGGGGGGRPRPRGGGGGGGGGAAPRGGGGGAPAGAPASIGCRVATARNVSVAMATRAAPPEMARQL